MGLNHKHHNHVTTTSSRGSRHMCDMSQTPAIFSFVYYLQMNTPPLHSLLVDIYIYIYLLSLDYIYTYIRNIIYCGNLWVLIKPTPVPVKTHTRMYRCRYSQVRVRVALENPRVARCIH